MDPGPLVAEQIEAGAKFLAEFAKSYPLQEAFWLKDSEEGGWFLYVASDQITDENFDVAYGEVVRIAGTQQDPWFDPFQLKVIGADDPLAKATVEVRSRYPAPKPIRLQSRTFGGVAVEAVYLYPSPL